MIIFTKYIIIFLLVFLLFTFIYSLYLKNSKVAKKDANWELGQEKNAEVLVNGNGVIIKNLRDFNWAKESDSEQARWIDDNFDLADITGVKMGVSHFSAKSGIAHVFVIFEIDGHENIALSIESRREVGEDFEILKGLTYDYELIYVLASERDVIDIRRVRNEKVYIYPTIASPEKSQELFVALSEKINSLHSVPEFYHLFTKNCTNSIAREIEKISNKRFPFIEKTFLPGSSAQALFAMGLIDAEKLDFIDMQKDFLVDFSQI